MITTQKIVKLFFNTLASLVCFMSTYVFALELPSSARLVLSDTTDVKNISVEISAWIEKKAFLGSMLGVEPQPKFFKSMERH